MDFQFYVDRVLNEYKDGRVIHLYGVIREKIHELKDKNEQRIFVGYLVEKNLLERAEGDNEWEYIITNYGYEIITSGGWLRYLSTLDNEHNELIKLRAEKEKSEKIKFHINTVIGVIGLVLLGIPIYQTTELNRQKVEIDKLSRDKDSLSTMTNIFDSLSKENYKEIIELRKTLDSLNKSE